MDVTTDHVSRTEYEQFTRMYELRHSELRLENKELETEIKTQLAGMGIKIDTLATQVSQRGNDGWKLLATSMTSLVGGYLLYYLQHLLVR